MTLLVPDGGEVIQLKALLGVETVEDLKLCLYVNDKTPADGDVLADYTEMSTLSYANKTLTKTSWTVAHDSGSGKALASYAAQTFNFTAGTPVTVYGYFVKRASTGDLVWAERFVTPHPLGNSGDVIQVTPKFTFSKE